jgi:hypothetical protein
MGRKNAHSGNLWDSGNLSWKVDTRGRDTAPKVKQNCFLELGVDGRLGQYGNMPVAQQPEGG